jgi:hypothetical protein
MLTPMMPSSGKRTWEEKLTRSGFFVGALLFHLVIFLLVATYVIFPSPPPEPQGPGPVPPRPTVAVVTPPRLDVVVPTDAISDASSSSSSLVPTIIGGPGTETWMPPVPSPGNGVGDGPTLPPRIGSRVPVTGPKIPGGRLADIGRFERAHRTDADIRDHLPDGTFPVYVASYADGDWSCNIQLDPKGNITSGSLPNLTAKIEEWTHGVVKAYVVPKPLGIGGPELLDTKPPFIFFTGHKDFVLTDKEIENLKAYVEEGGAIWGDNALAGKGSRFDVAFKREMKRVVPDLDKNFEPLALDTEVFTQQRFPISKLPEGMNYYSEQIEHLDIDGVPAIVYTPNDYSDLYAMRILPGDRNIEGDHPDRKSTSPLFSNGTFLHNETIFFRNFTLPSSIAVHRLGLNMVTYLITRFDNYLLLTPP